MTRSTPAFTEAIDWATGWITARGCLTAQGVDLVRGAPEVLRRSGHRQVTVDLREVFLPDVDAVNQMRSVVVDLAAHGAGLVVLLQRENRSTGPWSRDPTAALSSDPRPGPSGAGPAGPPP